MQNSHYFTSAKRSKRGAALIIALALTLCITMVIVGTQMMIVQQLKVSRTERDYERALMMAEAGVNAYVNGLAQGPGAGTNAAYIPPAYNFSTSALGTAPSTTQFRTGVLNGTYVVIKYPAGSQQGYFVGETAGTGNTTLVTSYGWSHGIVRKASVTVTATSGSASNGYALFTGNSGSFNGSTTVGGTIGTNGTYSMNGSNTITGNVEFDGASSGWASNPNGNNSYGPVIHNNTPVAWPTVETLANQAFPLGGLLYLSLINDNLLSGILLDTVAQNGGSFTFNSKPGGANYYLTSLKMNGASIFFNNNLGPITIWIGPGGGKVSLNGSSYAVTMAQNPAYGARIYDASTGNISINGSTTLNVGIYNINNAASGAVTVNGSSTINTSIIANTFTSNGGSSIINYTGGYFPAPGNATTYSSSGWTEID